LALRDSWQDLEDKVQGYPDSGSEISVKPINNIAHAVIDLENQEPIQSNVQADWNEENPENPAYIKNKPTIPSVEGLASVEYVNNELSLKANKSETYTKTEVDNIINPIPITEAPTILAANNEYSLGELEELNIVFPSVANDGDVVFLTFASGETATTLSIDTTNTSDIEVIPEPNCYYDIFGKFNGSIWLLNYSEYTVSEV
jgi:hypothetical protein